MSAPLCALNALEVGEPLFGTAPHEKAWLFLEHTGPWGARALEESDLPEVVKGRLLRLRRETGARVSFIRRAQDTPPPWRLMLWRADPQGGRCARWALPDLEALLHLPLEDWLRGTRPLPAEALCSNPLYLVCVNARRDACCGRFGPLLYRALQRLRPDAVWMSTHIGGHRFAPNLMVLSHGLAYGRVRSAEDAAAIVQATEQSQVHLGLLGGRLALPRPAQAAEHFLRQRTGARAVDAFRLAWLRESPEHHWEAAFLGPEEQAYRVTLRREKSPLQRPTSCGAPAKPMRFYRLQAIETHPVRRYRAAGGVIVGPEGKVLVLLRPSRREVRLPKGHIEPGEEPWVAARREIAEEAGLSPEDMHPLADLGVKPVGFLYEGALVWRHEHYFLVQWQSGSLIPGETQFLPLWLPWAQAEAALTYPAEKAWLRRAREAYQRLQEEPQG
ncbi:MAG TPA: NUDIX domain-containing protein [Anaerolineae bacterium]|nr:NUDIX domain-containing protein [Anaerolineae bacterium]